MIFLNFDFKGIAVLKWSEKLTGDSHGHWRAGPSSSARLDHAGAKGHAAVPEEKGLKI